MSFSACRVMVRRINDWKRRLQTPTIGVSSSRLECSSLQFVLQGSFARAIHLSVWNSGHLPRELDALHALIWQDDCEKKVFSICECGRWSPVLATPQRHGDR